MGRRTIAGMGWTAAVVGAVVVPLHAHALLLPAGPDVTVSTEVAAQGGAAVAHFSDGRYLMAWSKHDGGCCGTPPLVGRVFESTGEAVGAEFPLGTHGNAWLPPQVVVVPGNRFVVVGNAYGNELAHWQLFDQAGMAVGPDVTIPSPGPNRIFINAAAPDANDDLAILYEEVTSVSPFALQLKIQRYDLTAPSIGTPIGSPILVHESFEGGAANDPVGLSRAADGSLVVSWVLYDLEVLPGDDAFYPTILLRRYDASGFAIGADVSIDGPLANGNIDASMTTDGVGHAYVAYEYNPECCASDSYHLKRVNLATSEVLDLALPSGDARWIRPLIAASADGRMTLAWSGARNDGYQAPHGFIQRYAADGSLDGASLPAGDDMRRSSSISSLSMNAGGSVVVALTRRGPRNSYWVDSRMQRFCDTDDSTCLICPAFGDAVDSDADALPDGCDPCTNVGGAQAALRASAKVSQANSTDFYPGQPRQDNIVIMKQSFVLPTGVDFGSLALDINGARLRIESMGGQAMADIAVPGGTYAGRGTAGWTHKGSRFLYRDTTDSTVNGLRRVVVADRSRSEPGLVNVSAKASGGEYRAQYSYPPMKSIVVLGGPAAAGAGICSEAPFEAEHCSEFFFVDQIGHALNRCRL